MFDLISIGNVSIDLFYRDDSLTFKDGRFQLAVGGKYFTNYFYTSVGGGGANVAIGAQRMGLKTGVLAKIGNNSFKEVILDALKKEDVSSYLCQLEDEYINISSILLTPKGERAIINFETPRQHIIKHERELLKLKTKSVFFGNLPDVPFAEKIKLLYFFKQHEVVRFANLGVKDCRRSISQLSNFLNKVSVLIVNGHEFADLVKKSYAKINFKDDVTDLLPILKGLTLIVTLDKKGSYSYVNDTVTHVPAPDVKKVIDSTGAGDAFTGAFIAEYLKSQDPVKAMEKGSSYAGKILMRVGAN